MTKLVPRDFMTVPSMRSLSLLDELDELMTMPQAEGAGSVAISEDEHHIFIEAALPGVDPDEVEVTYDRGILWIRGEHNEEERNKKRKYYRRAAQAFSYRIAIPGEVDSKDQPIAAIKHGVVTISFPKLKIPPPQKITVQKSDGK